MQFSLHATRRTPHGASGLVQAISTWLAKALRAPSGIVGLRESVVIQLRLCTKKKAVMRPAQYAFEAAQLVVFASGENVVALVFAGGDNYYCSTLLVFDVGDISSNDVYTHSVKWSLGVCSRIYHQTNDLVDL